MPRRGRRHAPPRHVASRSTVFIPPNWDRSYTECFGFTLEEIYTEGARSLEAKLRSAGLPLDFAPGPARYSRFDLSTRAGAHEYGLAMLQGRLPRSR